MYLELKQSQKGVRRHIICSPSDGSYFLDDSLLPHHVFKKKHMGEERTVVWGRRVTFYIHDLTPALVLLTPSVKIQIWGAPPQTILIRYCWWVGSISVFITCSPVWFFLTPKHKHHFLMRKLGFSIRSSQVVNVGGAAGAGPGRM